jgi:hypothetical protein
MMAANMDDLTGKFVILGVDGAAASQ